jgi:hypothetical protein
MVRLPMLRTRSVSASLLAGFTATTLVLGGCASLDLGPSTSFAAVDLDRPEMRQFPVASMTDMERDLRLETSDRGGEKLTPALFWTGISLGTVGAVGGVAFGVLGYTTKRELIDNYQSGMSYDDRDTLSQRGKTWNALAVAMTTVSVLGYALAIVTYGVDWNRCGPLVLKNEKRRCADVNRRSSASE